MEEDRGRMRERVDALEESLRHIREIVAMQQRYARTSAPTETSPLIEVVDDALRLSGGAFSRGGITIIREYEDGIRAKVDRHKVLQILFNLLENARLACSEGEKSGKSGGKVWVRVTRVKGNAVEVCVSDNGVGIAAEHLPCLFSQGFSLRKEGHGFGLHSSAMAAQDMGGALTARSDGPGLGAEFRLHIPLTPL
jgi:signal transduction histidine kinase